MINSFDRWCADMASAKYRLTRKRKKDPEEAREVKDKPRKRHRGLREARKGKTAGRGLN